MPYNGSGVFSVATPGTPFVTGTTISSTVANAVNTDFATGLSTCITKNGQTTVTANLPMGGFKFTGLAAGSAAGDSVRWEQLGVIVQNSQTAGYTCVLTDAGKHIYMTTAGTYTIPANASVAYTIGTAITFVNGTTSCTIPITSDTMTLAGTATTGTRTLAANGIATAIKTTSTTWIISGTGLS